MEVTKLFEVLAAYLDFTIDVLLLEPLDEYARHGSVNPTLVSYFVAGVLLAYVIAAAKTIPSYETRIPSGENTNTPPPSSQIEATTGADKKEVSPFSKESLEIPGFVVLSILGVFVFHGALLIYHTIHPSSAIGNVKDSFNATFAIGAVWNPLNALLKQIQRIAIALAAISKGCAVLSSLILIFLSLIYFGFFYYFLYAFAEMHATSKTYLIPVFAIFGLAGAALAVLTLQADRTASDSTVSDSELPSQL